jgi:aldose sugar dehydrogenase
VLFRMEPALQSSAHAGGRLVFAPDGLLLVTLGDRSILQGRVQARNLASHLRKVARIEPRGGAHRQPVRKTEPRAALDLDLWPPQRAGRRTLQPDRLWVTEMGPRGGDEHNLVQRGKDYAWPLVGYSEEYSGQAIHQQSQADGLEQPVYYCDSVISPSGMVIYSGTICSPSGAATSSSAGSPARRWCA